MKSSSPIPNLRPEDDFELPVFTEPMEDHPHPGIDALIEHAESLREWYPETPTERLARKCRVRFEM